MDEPIKLTTFGNPNTTNDVSTNATAESIDNDTSTPVSDTKPNTTSTDKNIADGLLEEVLGAPSSTSPQETAIDSSSPQNPNKMSTFGHPVSNAQAQDPGFMSLQIGQANTAIGKSDSVALQPQPPSANTTDCIDVPLHDTASDAVALAPKLSTFGTPIAVNSVVDTSSSPKTDEQQQPDKQTSNTASNVVDTVSLSKEDSKSQNTDTVPKPDDHADRTIERVEFNLNVNLDGIPPPLLLADDKVECNSLESTGEMKVRLFGTEMDPDVGDVTEKKASMLRFYVLVFMASATVTMISVAIALLVFINYANLANVLGFGVFSTPVPKDNVTIEGEVRINGLLFPPIDELLSLHEKDFINWTDMTFNNSQYRSLYRKTSVTGIRNGSVIIDFTVQLKPITRIASFTVLSKYNRATSFLEQALERDLNITGSSGGVDVLKLHLFIGSEMAFGARPTTETPQLPTPSQKSTDLHPSTHFSTTYKSTSRPSTTQSSTGQVTTGQMTTNQQPTTISPTTSMTGTTMANQQQTEWSTSVMTMTTTEVSANTVSTFNPATDPMTTRIPNDNSTNAGAVNDEAMTEPGGAPGSTVYPSPTPSGRKKRSLQPLSTTARVTKEPATRLMSSPRITSKGTGDVVTRGCFTHPLLSCVVAGWSQNTTLTPNRFQLWNDSNQILQVYATLMHEVDITSPNGGELQRVICSLLSPSCDYGLTGLRLPCRSTCTGVVRSLNDTHEARTLEALCNTSLPESESESICFRTSHQNNGFDTRTPCYSSYCLNGGSCFDVKGQAYCRCPREFGGDRCQIDPCTPNPCYNDSTCRGQADFITSYACGCQAGYHGRHCELTTGDPMPPTIPIELTPHRIREPACRDVLPYNLSISDTRAPDWGVVKPFASCSTDAQLMFCAMAFPEFYISPTTYQWRAPCKEVCNRVLSECDILFHALNRFFPGICRGLGTSRTEVIHFCT